MNTKRVVSSGNHGTRTRLASTVLALGAMAGMASAENAARPPLEKHPDRLFSVDTANQLQEGQVRMWIGTHQTQPGKSTGGTGNQYYWGGMEWGVSDRFQLGFSHAQYNDPTMKPVSGTSHQVRQINTSLQGKYGLVDTGTWKVAAQASVEQMIFRSSLYGIPATGSGGEHVIGSFFLPVTYAPSDALQLHFTPGVSFLPDTVNGTPFYGTVGSVTGGFSYKPGRRWLAYGSLSMPVSGGNTITSTGAIDKEPIWTVGGRYNVTPKAALDLFVTNGGGMTPATGILTTIPDGDTTMVGAMVSYTPGRGPGYAPNYRGLSGEPLSTRQQHLQYDGFNLTSADTLSPGRFAVTARGGSFDSSAVKLQFSPDYDGQIELAYEQHANDGSVGNSQVPSHEPFYALGLKLRFMDQNNGSPFSLAGHVMLGRDTTTQQNGVFYLAMPMTYKANSRLAMNMNPKAAAWGSNEVYGLGLGVNYELASGLEAIGEVTPVSNGGRTVWAAGLRYFAGGTPLSIDLQASNAIGDFGLGTMVGQSDTKWSLGGTLHFDWGRN